MPMRRFALLVALFPVVGLAACSGGGSSGGSGGALPVLSAPQQTTQVPASSTTASLSGTVVDLPYGGSAPGYSMLPNGTAATPGAPIAGAAIYVGPHILTSLTAPATVPAGFSATVSDASGRFRIASAPSGQQTITIFAAAPHTAILHQDVALPAGGTASATYYLTAPTAAETAWLATENDDRAAFSVAPTSFDEAVIESARYWAAFMSRNDYFAHCIPAAACDAGSTLPDPASYGPQDVDPTHRFYFEHGFSGATEGENVAADFSSWRGADAAFMAERSLCPNGEPANCPFTEQTGHFLNIVDTSYAWTGFGIVAPSASSSYYDEEFAEVWQTTPHTTAVTRRQNFAPGLRP
ncbi:MAG: hypothetical protein IAI48_02270 [Candidatus Eremiobacteraeota bacterium]|nr:hypothetical protein [Candidatus Eremiobacteraeota bacterium]